MLAYEVETIVVAADLIYLASHWNVTCCLLLIRETQLVDSQFSVVMQEDQVEETLDWVEEAIPRAQLVVQVVDVLMLPNRSLLVMQ